VFTLIALAAALAVMAGFPLSLNMSRFRENLAWVDHTNQVLRQLSATERAVLEAESSERGYLLTGDAAYLSTYNQSKDAIPKLLSSLRDPVADNTAQQKPVDVLRSDIEARLDELARVVQLGPQGRAEALDILKSARVSQLTPRIIAGLSQLRQHELSLLATRQGDADRSALFATLSAAALFMFALISATFGVFYFEHQRTIQERTERERQLRETQTQLFQLARLSAIGEMAASIAHELNQPLTASANYLNGSRRLLDGLSDERVRKARDALAKAAKEALRAGEVIRRLRDFIKQGEIDPKVENVKAMVEEAVALALHATTDRSLYVGMQFDPAAKFALVDKIQIQQVILNLMRNASKPCKPPSVESC
jgi:CHASE3 domain sensor protein